MNGISFGVARVNEASAARRWNVKNGAAMSYAGLEKSSPTLTSCPGRKVDAREKSTRQNGTSSSVLPWWKSSGGACDAAGCGRDCAERGIDTGRCS
jgi:hypothetical protein